MVMLIKCHVVSLLCAVRYLIIFITTSGVPPREESLLSLQEDKAVEMQVWGGAILPVTKLKCSFDKAFCVVDEETREMLEMYRMVLRPLAFRQLHKRDSYEMAIWAKFEQTMQRNKDLQVLLNNAVHNFDKVLFYFVHKIKIACAGTSYACLSGQFQLKASCGRRCEAAAAEKHQDVSQVDQYPEFFC